LARIERPYDIQLLVVPTDSVATGNYLAAEKLAPVTSLFTVATTDDGINVCRRLLEIDGMGHTAIIHARDADLIRRFSTTIPASRIIVNARPLRGSWESPPAWCRR
jgi:acetaldehyde dehydrogenase/alcohol dehydrogenase